MKKSKISIPHSIVLMMIMAVIFAIMTWIIPAGVYDTEVVNGKTQYIAGTYHAIEQTGVGFWDLMKCVVNGFTKNAGISFMLFFTGAAIYMLDQTKCLSAIFGKLAGMSSKSTSLVIFVFMAFLSLAGSTGAVANSTVALMPVGVLLASALGMDKAMAFILIYLGAYAGFNVGATNVFTVAVAQGMADLPIFSGAPVRVFFHICNLLFTYFWCMMYAKKIHKDPRNSLNWSEGREISEFMGFKALEGEEANVTTQQWASFGGFIVAIMIVILASFKWNWGMTDFTAVFLLLCIYIAVVNKFTLDEFVKSLINGCKTMMGAVLITSFCGGLSLVLNQGNIIHTIVYYASIPIAQAGAGVGAVLMFIFNYIVNFFIPSGSGQAAAVMPLMIPLADISGITRQVAVMAYQFGSGLCDSIIPTSGTLMACLALSEIPYGKYMKWVAPYIIAQIVFSCVACYVLQIIGWTGL